MMSFESTNLDRITASNVSMLNEDQVAGYASGPERNLMSALLFDGLSGYIAYQTSTGPKRKRYLESYKWVSNPSDDYIFSFDNICEALGINSQALRSGLNQLKYDSSIKRMRRCGNN